MATQVQNNLSGAIGSRFLPTHNQLLFVEYGGKVSVLDLIRPYVATVSAGSTVLRYDYNMSIRWATFQVGPKYRVLGTGYTELEDIAATADEASAYLTERGGNLYKISLAAANRARATVVAGGMTAPPQLFLDEANHAAYVVEFAASGRLLKIALPGGATTPLVTGLERKSQYDASALTAFVLAPE